MTTREYRRELIAEGIRQGRQELAEEILGDITAACGSLPAAQPIIQTLRGEAYPTTGPMPGMGGMGAPRPSGGQSPIERCAATVADARGLPPGWVRTEAGDIVHVGGDEPPAPAAEGLPEGVRRTEAGDLVL